MASLIRLDGIETPVYIDTDTNRALIQRYDSDDCRSKDYTWVSGEGLSPEGGGCGYLEEPLVRAIAALAVRIVLNVTHDGRDRSMWTDHRMALESLRTKDHWQKDEITASWHKSDGDWVFGPDCTEASRSNSISRWPDMYRSCNMIHGVDWITNPGGPFQDGSGGSYAEPWQGKIGIHSCVYSTEGAENGLTASSTWLELEGYRTSDPTADPTADPTSELTFEPTSQPPPTQTDEPPTTSTPTPPNEEVPTSVTADKDSEADPALTVEEPTTQPRATDIPSETKPAVEEHSESTTAIVIVLLHIPACILLAVCVIVSRRRRSAQLAEYRNKYPHLVPMSGSTSPDPTEQDKSCAEGLLMRRSTIEEELTQQQQPTSSSTSHQEGRHEKHGNEKENKPPNAPGASITVSTPQHYTCDQDQQRAAIGMVGVSQAGERPRAVLFVSSNDDGDERIKNNNNNNNTITVTTGRREGQKVTGGTSSFTEEDDHPCHRQQSITLTKRHSFGGFAAETKQDVAPTPTHEIMHHHHSDAREEAKQLEYDRNIHRDERILLDTERNLLLLSADEISFL